MRIIGGRYGGLHIPRIADHGAAAARVRPMTDRMRESLFMALELRFPFSDAVVADLFAGTGAIALEALSRGAAAATLCDISRASVNHLRTALPPPVYRDKQLTIHHQRAEPFIRHSTRAYDFIFLDPPYDYPDHHALLASVGASALCADRSVIVIHYRYGTGLSFADARLTSVWGKRFGDSAVHILQRNDSAAGKEA